MLPRQTGRQADRQAGRQTDRQTDMQTDRQTDRERERERGRERERETCSQKGIWASAACAPWARQTAAVPPITYLPRQGK
jgi:hypothetical protein